LVGRQEGHPVCKKPGVILFVGDDDFTGALYVLAPVVTTFSINLSSNEVHSRDILPGEMAAKLEREGLIFTEFTPG